MKLQPFYHYLKSEGYKETTIYEDMNCIERLMQWATENHQQDITQISHQEILQYVQYLKSQSLTTQSINNRINSIRKYYEHLKQERVVEKNPTRKLYIKGAVKAIVQRPLSFSELEIIYQQYIAYLERKPILQKKQEITNLRSKVILGLMIWQGLHSGELQKLQVAHIKLQQGSVYIPSTTKSKVRELPLSPQQIIPLHAYLTSLQAHQMMLFDCTMDNQITRITGELKGINGLVKNGLHIRASVILHWLKIHDKRQVQYMIGHKWISSTEHYQEQDLESLTDELSKHHPFG